MDILATESTEQFLSGGGEMGKLIRSMDWSKTALGPVESWPQSLRTSVSLCLSSTFPILIAWGPETIQIYNDSYRPICGAMHPQSMGMNFRICWESALEVVGDKFTRGQQGEGTYIHDQRMFLQRYGYLEEAFMTFSFAPIRDESGGVGGIFHPITETTDKMLSARRTQVLRDLGAAVGKAKSIEEIASETANKYQEFLYDLPFTLFYKYDPQQQKAQLIGSSGTDNAHQLAVNEVDLTIPSEHTWPFQQLIDNKESIAVTSLEERFGSFSCEPYPETPHTAVLIPIHISGQEVPFGFLVAGVSARRALDQAYMGFYDLLGNTYNTAVSNVYAYEQEQKRAEALAAIDRSKTAFFSNVSHEFRTPLTLMLGPLEDLQTTDYLSPEIKESVNAAHRNAIRLLKLVNNLLDYSRVEAGRLQASYQPLDLRELTTDLASSFRSIIEKAEMILEVDCQEIKERTYIDRQMWEKIVLNLLSNAFKYTLKGKISVKLYKEADQAVLQVSDTGVGIPEKELPHMFERFHRVQHSEGRTHEGTGIGLSLVNELVQLHGGRIGVESTKGIGSTFTVTIPLGKAHLPPEQVLETTDISSSADLRGAFLNEAASLLETAAQASDPSLQKLSEEELPSAENIKLLVVDDNKDMREYLVRLLAPHFTVFTASNGQQALEKVTELRPSLVISDVMMPVMDGKQFLQALRSSADIFQTPVILLSARAGEESKIDGLEAGADDYLVKPFSAAELLTKIRAQIKISAARGKTEAHLRHLFMEAPVAIAIYRGPEHIIELANGRMLEYWGRSQDQVAGKRVFHALPELEHQGFRDIVDKVYQTGERFTSDELPIQLLRYGHLETIYINLNIQALEDEQGRINGLMTVSADVTSQVNARKALEKATGTLQLAVDAAGMGIWRSDLATGEIHISKNAKEIHGIPYDHQMSFQQATEMVIAEHRERVLNAIAHAIQTKGSFNEDYQIRLWNSQQYKWLNTTGKAELDSSGEVTGAIGTILDISEQKEDEQRKNDFIAMVSHELKTPLTSMNGYAQLMKLKAKNNTDGFIENTSGKILNQVNKMTGLINGFLNVSRLDSGKIHLQHSSFEVNALISEMITDIMPYGEQDHEINFEPQGSIYLLGDRDKIGTVITNILGNAIKYSPRDTIIFFNCQEIDQQIHISVSDQGKGIAPNDLDRLFDRYFRIDNQDNKRISGFGIGLYLSAEIIKRHHGKIWAESQLGMGTTFHLLLPKQDQAAQAPLP